MLALRPRLALLVGLCSGLAGCQATLFGAVNLAAGSPEGSHREAILYSPEHELRLDVYRPEAGRCPCPLLVFFYGGSWQNGERGWYRFFGQRLADEGVVVVIPDYRTYPEVTFPGFMTDAAAAVRWAEQHRGELAGESAPLFVGGHSAGAQMAVLLATDPRYLEAAGSHPSRLSGVLGLAGPYDFLPITSSRIARIFPSATAEMDAQPVRFVSGEEPPMLLLHGDDDRVVGPRNSEVMADRLAAAGAAVEHRHYADMGHFGLLLAFWPPRDDFRPVLADTLDFLHGKP